MAPTNGSLGNYSHTREGANLTYQCDKGFTPSAVFHSTCDSSAMWTPDPEDHNCTFVTGIHMMYIIYMAIVVTSVMLSLLF